MYTHKLTKRIPTLCKETVLFCFYSWIVIDGLLLLPSKKAHEGFFGGVLVGGVHTFPFFPTPSLLT